MKKLAIFLLILIIPFTFAGSADYTIDGDEVLTKLSFSAEEFQSIKIPSEKTVLEFNPDSYVEYTTPSFLEKSRNDYFFIVDNEFHVNSKITVTLPIGAILDSKYFVFPKNYTMSTNGQNIIISWDNSTEKEVLIAYTIPTKFSIWPIILSLIVILLLYYIIIKKRKRKNDNYTKNLFGDEKKIMKYLSNKKECWTKEIARDLKISKVKLSRRLRRLEEKGLISRTPHGNENRITLIK